MALHKIVNGESVPLSEEEEQVMRLEWEQNEQKALLEAQARDAYKYLNDTDFLVIRASMEGYELSQEVKTLREQARVIIRAAQ